MSDPNVQPNPAQPVDTNQTAQPVSPQPMSGSQPQAPMPAQPSVPGADQSVPTPVTPEAMLAAQPVVEPQPMPAEPVPAQPVVTPEANPNPVTPAPAVQQTAPATNESGKTYKVIVVDDEPDQLEIFKDILSSDPALEVSTAVDGVDALAKSEATKFDLMLLDIVMPKKDGVQTLSELKSNPEKYGNPRVLMLTNIGGDLAIEESLKLGAVGYRTKIDTEPDELLRVVKEELEKA